VRHLGLSVERDQEAPAPQPTVTAAAEFTARFRMIISTGEMLEPDEMLLKCLRLQGAAIATLLEQEVTRAGAPPFGGQQRSDRMTVA
jgi:hypothetical protein